MPIVFKVCLKDSFQTIGNFTPELSFGFMQENWTQYAQQAFVEGSKCVVC